MRGVMGRAELRGDTVPEPRNSFKSFGRGESDGKELKR